MSNTSPPPGLATHARRQQQHAVLYILALAAVTGSKLADTIIFPEYFPPYVSIPDTAV